MPRPRNQSTERLFSLTTNATNHLSRNTINGLQISDTVNVKPIMKFVPRSAHGQPKFKYQETREWGADTPEDLDKQSNRIRVSSVHIRELCGARHIFVDMQELFNDHYFLIHTILFSRLYVHPTGIKTEANYAYKIALNPSPESISRKNYNQPPRL